MSKLDRLHNKAYKAVESLYDAAEKARDAHMKIVDVLDEDDDELQYVWSTTQILSGFVATLDLVLAEDEDEDDEDED